MSAGTCTATPTGLRAYPGQLLNPKPGICLRRPRAQQPCEPNACLQFSLVKCSLRAGNAKRESNGLPAHRVSIQPCSAAAVRGAACRCEVRLTILLGPDSVSVSTWQSNGRCQRVQYRQHVRAQQRNWWPDRLHVQSRRQGLRRPALSAPRDGHYPGLGGAPVDARGHTDSEEGKATKFRVLLLSITPRGMPGRWAPRFEAVLSGCRNCGPTLKLR